MSHSESSARRRKHLTSLLKREGFTLDDKCYLGTQRLSETWSKISGHLKETMTFNKFDHEHRDIIRDLLRGIRSPNLKGTDTALYTDRYTFHYKMTHNFQAAPVVTVPALKVG